MVANAGLDSGSERIGDGEQRKSIDEAEPRARGLQYEQV